MKATALPDSPPVSEAAPPAAWGGPDSVFERLEGRWSLDRRIEDQAVMTGSAVFRRCADGLLHYFEQGRLQIPDGRSFQAHRRYVFERAAAGFHVHFDERPLRLFHTVRLIREAGAWHGHPSHWCAPDQYDSSYRFEDGGSFSIRHLVQGPRKDYVSVTVYRRAGR